LKIPNFFNTNFKIQNFKFKQILKLRKF
jgi:hypothetical protein